MDQKALVDALERPGRVAPDRMYLFLRGRVFNACFCSCVQTTRPTRAHLPGARRTTPGTRHGVGRRSHKPNARVAGCSVACTSRSRRWHKARSASVVARASTRKGTCRIAIPLLDRPSSNASTVTRSYSELLEELIAHSPRALVDLDLHRADLAVNLLHELHHKVDELVLPHGLEVKVGQQKGNVVALEGRGRRGLLRCQESGVLEGKCAVERQGKRAVAESTGLRTGIGFRRRMMKLSARCIKKRENLLARIASISSICFTLMLTRTELTAVSIMTHSCSERWITIGLSRSSLLELRAQINPMQRAR